MNIKARIIDNTKLELLEDAKKGDIIDLRDLVELDLSFLTNKIQNEATALYQKTINEQYDLKVKELQTANEKALIDLNNKKEKEIADLNNQIDNKNKEKEHELELAKLTLKEEYEQKLNDLKNSKDLEISKLTNNLEKSDDKSKIALRDQQLEYERKINILQNNYDKLKTEHSLDILKIDNKHNLEIANLKEEINRLTLQKSSSNVKKLGEQLEHWCNEEYQNYAVAGFKNCTWEKDNDAIKLDDDKKATKADYIFKIYLDSNHDTILSSVCCEMKNEDPLSINKKKNSDHYAKLDKDRSKKGCEYALLISELEWDSANDSPIKVIPEYPKMYLVRPQYFITFLAIIYSLTEKYHTLLLAKDKENIILKDKQILTDEFDNLIQTYLNKPLDALNKKIEDILSNSNIITKANQKIIDTCNDIIAKTINTIREKVNTLDLKKLPSFYRKLDKINNN